MVKSPGLLSRCEPVPLHGPAGQGSASQCRREIKLRWLWYRRAF